MRADYLIDADCLLRNLKNGMELLSSTEEKLLGLNSLVVRSIGEILSHGLRESKYGYWHVVRELTHSSTRQCIARALKHVSDNQERGLFWIYYTLVEGSLDSYLQCLVTDKSVVQKNYLEYALIRDNFCATKFILLLTSLAQINFLPLDSTSCVGVNPEVIDNHKPFDPLTYFQSNNSFLHQETPSSTGASSPTDSGVHGSMETFSPETSTPVREKPWPSDHTLIPLEATFSDCSLSSAAEPAVVRRRKRVSFHETVLGDGPKGTVWERRSADVETMAWWKCNQAVEDHGEEALELERGVPEGSDDPQALFSELTTEAVATRLGIPPKWKPSPTKKVKSSPPNLREKRGGHLLSLYPGPCTVPEMEVDDYELDVLDVPLMIQVSGTQLALERLLDSTVHKIFKMVDVDSNPYVCAFTNSDICLLTLNTTLNFHRITYQEMEYICVGPSSEHITFQNGEKFLLTSRGEEFCSWLHYATSAHNKNKKPLDFLRISPQDAFRKAFNGLKDMDVEEVIQSTWAVVCDSFNSSDLAYNDHLMFSVGNAQAFWEPAFVEISSGGTLEIRPCTKGLKALSLPLDSCCSCERSSGARPHTFTLKFGTARSPMTVCLAAPDDYVMSSWMQAVLVAVASRKSKSNRENLKSNSPNGHHLVVSPGFIALVNSARDNVMSRALLRDIAGLLTGPAYVILELDCHEVEDKASDWILYFYCEELKNKFISLLVDLRPQLRQMIFEHKVMSCNWVKCETERNLLDAGFEPIISYIKSL